MEREDFLSSVEEKDERLEALKQLYPEIFSDGKINLDAFKEATGTSDLPEGEDKTPGYYGLYWPGKSEAKQLAKKPATGTLEPVPGDGVNEENTHNIYIEGDNLEVLRTLRNSYRGRVKMIYIDPPYNTGTDFIYPDNYSMTINEYLKITGQINDKGYKLVANPKSSGAFHRNWLNMMYSRLIIARDLLTENGVIFISIDDNEQSNLKMLCNEVFYEENFIGQLIIETATDNNPSQIVTQHEYMLCYAKDKEMIPKWDRTSEAAELINKQYQSLKEKGLSISAIQNELRSWIKKNEEKLPQVSHYNSVDEKGVYSSSQNSSNPHPGDYMYDIIHPITKKSCPKPANGWRWPEETFKKYEKEGEVVWGKDHTTQPHIKKRIETASEQLRSIIYEDNRAATKGLESLFDGVKVFDNPKPINVLYKLIDYVTEDNDIVMDFFAGSSSTAHALLKINDNDMKSRKFIMVQLPVNLDKSLETAKGNEKKQIERSIAFLDSINKIHTICELGKERIRRAGKSIYDSSDTKTADVGFKVYRLSESNFIKYRPIQGQTKEALDEFFASLDTMVDPLIDGWKAENVLEEIKLRQGFALDCKVEEVKEISSNKIWHLTDPDRPITLYVCLDKKIEQKTVDSLNIDKDNKFICLNSAIDDTTYARLADKNRIQTL